METMYRKYWDGGTNPVYTQAKVEDGVCTDAWIDQIGGNASGNAGNYIGMTVSELKDAGFEKYNPRQWF